MSITIETVRDLLEALDPDNVVIRAGERTHDGRRFAEHTYKTGNYFRHCGVHEGSIVEVDPTPAPETILGALGTALLGGQVTFTPGSTDSPVVRLGPTGALSAEDLPPGCTAVGFGDRPPDPAWGYFEREIWSENPFFPETDVDPDRPLLPGHLGPMTVGTVLDRAADLAAGFESEDVIAIRSAFDSRGTFVAGVLAPLFANATILLPAAGDVGTVAIASDDAPEDRVVVPESVLGR